MDGIQNRSNSRQSPVRVFFACLLALALSAASLIAIPSTAQASPSGSLDTAFNDSLSEALEDGLNDYVRSVAWDGSGYVIGGFFTNGPGEGAGEKRMFRIDEEGNPDESFNNNLNNGIASEGLDGAVRWIEWDGTGYVVIGSFTNAPGTGAGSKRVFRVNADGTPDSTFNDTLSQALGGLNGVVYNVEWDGTGYVVGGNFTDGPGTGGGSKRVFRVNADGTLDSTFNNSLTGALAPNGLNAYVMSVVWDGSGYLVSGNFTNGPGTGAGSKRAFRVNANGTLDSTFNNSLTGALAPNGLNDQVYSVAWDGTSYLLAGAFTNGPGTGAGSKRVFRANANGTLDTAFNNTLSGALASDGLNGTVFSAMLDDQGYLIAGQFSNAPGTGAGDKRVFRVDNDGTPNPTFNDNLSNLLAPDGLNEAVFPVVWDGSGYLVAGRFTNAPSAPGTSNNRVFRTTFAASPTVLTVAPDVSTSVGGVEITIAGTNLQGSSVTIGGAECTNVVVNEDGSELTCLTPPGAVGAAEVIVTSDGGPVEVEGDFTYEQSVPTVTSVAPDSGTSVGGTQITISGTQFGADATVTLGGQPCTNVVVASLTELSCITPATVDDLLGTVDVVVANTDDGTATMADGYTYEQSVPTITDVLPELGPNSGGTSITISGTQFGADATVTVGGESCTDVVVVSLTEITCATPAGANGPADIAVTNTDGGTVSSVDAFEFISVPTIDSIAPDAGTIYGGTSITLTGTQFAADATVTVGGEPCTDVVVVSDSEVTCVTPAGAGGPADVVITNTDGGTVTSIGGFTYQQSVPTISGVSPSSGSSAGGTAITIDGSDFGPDATVTVGGEPCANVVVVSGSEITCVTPAGANGLADVVVTNTDDGTVTAVNSFEFISVPTIDSIAPEFGPNTGGTPVTIAGTEFAADATVTVGGEACTDVVVVSDSEITCVTPAGASGLADVVVTNTDDGTVTSVDAFEFISVPTIDAITPDAGSVFGGTAVALTGTQFATDATVTVGGEPCTDVVVVSDSEITCVTPAGAIGPVDVVVTNADGGLSTLSDGFTFVQSAPAISGVSPDMGPNAGGTSITVSGTQFGADATVTIGGEPCANVVVVSGSEITCVTPAGVSGPADVVVTNTDDGMATSVDAFEFISVPTIDSIAPDAGSIFGGTPITVSGTQFGADATVTVGGEPCANVVVVSDSEITCVTPAGANGPADVVVTNTDGGTVISANGFTYQQSEPTISGVSPSSGSSAGGTVITIDGSDFGPNASVTVGGQPCAPVEIVSLTQIICTTPAGASGPADVVVTNTDDGAASMSGAFTFKTPTPPVPPASVLKPDKKPAKIRLKGKPRGNKFQVRWTKPVNTSSKRPVTRYRLTVQVRGKKRVILTRNLSNKRRTYTLTRKQLLKALRVSTRGEGDLRFVVRVRATNSQGNGPSNAVVLLLAPR